MCGWSSEIVKKFGGLSFREIYMPTDRMIQIYTNADSKYNVSLLWEMAPKAKRIDINRLNKGMYENLWGEEFPTPFEVLTAREGHHWDVAMRSDLRYPIIVTPNGWIADGNHRLIKAIVLKKQTIMARWFNTFEEMESAKISDID